MARDIHHFVTKQCACIKDKRPAIRPRAMMVPVKTNNPLELISLEYLHLEQSCGGYEYILVVVDHFTLYTVPTSPPTQRVLSRRRCGYQCSSPGTRKERFSSLTPGWTRNTHLLSQGGQDPRIRPVPRVGTRVGAQITTGQMVGMMAQGREVMPSRGMNIVLRD